MTNSASPAWAPQSVFASTEQIEVPADGMLDFNVKQGKLTYPCRFTGREGSDTLHVSIAAFTDRGKLPPPHFHRRNLEAGGHVLAVFDPSILLHRTMRIGCFLGTSKDDAVLGLIAIANQVAAQLQVPPTRIVYWGASAASLGAAMAAIRTGNGRGVVINPLLELENFAARPIGKPILQVFGSTAGNALLKGNDIRASTTVALQTAHKKGEHPRLIIVQNKSDQVFYEGQYLPFCRRWKLPETGGTGVDGTIMTVTFEDPAGHLAEGAELVKSLRGKVTDFLLGGVDDAASLSDAAADENGSSAPSDKTSLERYAAD